MANIDIALPFQRAYTLEAGRTRRTIEEHTVSLRVVEVPELVQAARSPDGRLLLEFDGFELNYIGDTRSTSSREAFFRGMDMKARYMAGKPPLRENGTVPRKGVIDDGRAVLASRISDVAAEYVVVEGCVARLGVSPGIEVTIEGNQTQWSRKDMPWLLFPLARQDEAASVAAAMREILGETLPIIEVRDARPFEILDAAAVRRMEDRADAVSLPQCGNALFAHARDVLGRLDIAAIRSLLALREAVDAKASGAELVDFLRDASDALSESPMPDGFGHRAWAVLKVAATGLSCRLDAMPGHEAAMAP